MKRTIFAVLILLSSSCIAQKKETIEKDTTANKIYLVVDTVKYQLFRDIKEGGKMGKYYYYNPDSTKNYSTFRRTPEVIKFDRIY